jgi:hypothetical protein
MCLFPAINAYAHVPLKIVAGTHRYGYGLVINPTKTRNVADLSGCKIPPTSQSRCQGNRK